MEVLKSRVEVKCVALAFCAALGALCATAAGGREGALMGALVRMELAGRVVAEAKGMSSLAEVADEAERFRGQMLGVARTKLVGAFEDPEEAQREFASFVEKVQASPDGYSGLRDEVVKGDLASDISAAGKFLGDVQSWLRLKDKGDVPPLAAWLGRDKKAGAPPSASAKSSNQKSARRKRPRNALRDSEAEAGDFVEAQDDGGSALGTFDTARKIRRQKAQKDAEQGMAQVAGERRIADEEHNAKMKAAAAAEAAAMQAHAQRLAAAEQEAIVQDQNSWRTRAKEIVSTAAGSAGSAFLGTVGNRVGEEAARSLFNHKKR